MLITELDLLAVTGTLEIVSVLVNLNFLSSVELGSNQPINKFSAFLERCRHSGNENLVITVIMWWLLLFLGKYTKECGKNGLFKKMPNRRRQRKAIRKKISWQNGDKRDHSGNLNHGITLKL